MKKLLLIIIVNFIFIPNVFAISKINSLEVNVNINDKGIAEVEEIWQIKEQSNNTFEKNFYNITKEKIDNISIINEKEEEYKKLDKDKLENNTYIFIDKKNTKLLKFNTNGKDTTLKIKYTIEGMVKKFDDFYGIDWYFITLNDKQEISTLNIYINGPVSLNENNTALYGIGKNISCNIIDGKIHLFSSKVTNSSKIRILSKFTDLTFENSIKIKKNFLDYYNKVVNEPPFIAEITALFDNMVFIIIMIIIFVIIISIIVYYRHLKKHVYNDYKNIISFNKQKVIGETNSVDYYDLIPCNGNIYKIYFLANYYNIIKHRSSLIGTLLFKWILDGIISLEEVDEIKVLKIKENMLFDKKEDQELYNILIKASVNQILDKNKLIRYCEDNSIEFLEFYQNFVKEVIRKEIEDKNAYIKNNKIYFNEKIYEEGKSILGLKRYLLNFNQVPRRSELNEEVYKYSLILSILLGVDKNLSEEILRKNKDNEMAKLLKEFEDIKYIYKNLYSNVYEKEKKNKKLKKKNLYLPDNN